MYVWVCFFCCFFGSVQINNRWIVRAFDWSHQINNRWIVRAFYWSDEINNRWHFHAFDWSGYNDDDLYSAHDGANDDLKSLN